MNAAEKKAAEAYEKNKVLVMSGQPISMARLCRIAQEQDRLYSVIHERIDRKMNNAADR